jgi:hypothetical protein
MHFISTLLVNSANLLSMKHKIARALGANGILFLLISACATKPLQPQAEAPAGLQQWESRAQIFDLRKKTSHTVGIDFLVEKKSRLRMDVTGPFSIGLATAVIADGQLSAIVPPKKQYFKGEANAASLARVTQLQLNPNILFDVLLDLPIKERGWNCQSKNILVEPQY